MLEVIEDQSSLDDVRSRDPRICRPFLHLISIEVGCDFKHLVSNRTKFPCILYLDSDTNAALERGQVLVPNAPLPAAQSRPPGPLREEVGLSCSGT